MINRFFSGEFDPLWPHVILLTTAISASLAVAAGIVMENPKWSLANVLVVGGVAVEAACTLLLFGFDEGISDRQQTRINDQLDKIVALETRISPRNLSPSQQREIADVVRNFSDTQFVTASYPSDGEGRRLEEQIKDTLISAGFRFLQRGGNPPPESLVTNVQISSNEEGKPVAQVLCASLKAKDIECNSDAGVVAGTTKTLLIWIGVKAIAEP